MFVKSRDYAFALNDQHLIELIKFQHSLGRMKWIIGII